jgi:hypothetical protein
MCTLYRTHNKEKQAVKKKLKIHKSITKCSTSTIENNVLCVSFYIEVSSMSTIFTARQSLQTTNSA